VNYACFNFFEPARFFADVEDSFDAYVSSAQQPNALLPLGFPFAPRSLRRDGIRLAQKFTVRFCTRDAPTAVEAPIDGNLLLPGSLACRI
jgi:hypothetical protein